MRALLITLILAIAAPLLAQDSAPLDFEREMPYDVRTAIEAIRIRYQTNRVHEKVAVILRRAGADRTEIINIRLEPRTNDLPDFQLKLEDFTIWSAREQDDRVIRVIHALDLKHYLQIPIPERSTPLEALQRNFPTIPLPQLFTAYDRDPLLKHAFPYASTITWSGALLGTFGQAAAILISATTEDGASIRIISGISISTLSETQLTYPDQRITLQTKSTLLSPPDDPSLGLPITNRTRVDTIAELAPRPDDLEPGDPLPPRALGPADQQGRRLVLLARDWNDEVAAALTDLRTAAENFKIPFDLLLAAEIDSSSNIAERIAAWQDLAAPTNVRYATSPAITIDRFSSSATAVAVVIDDQNTIRAMQTITPQMDTAGAPEETPAAWSSWLSEALRPR